MPSKEIKTYKELSKELDPEDGAAVLSMANVVIKNLRGRPYTYPPTEQGLESFRENSEGYFEYLENANNKLEQRQQIIPDIEGYCLWLGINRSTLKLYMDRGGAWEDMISMYKDVIAFCKKQLALKGKIPPVMAIFDLTNNHGYHNANEFKLLEQIPRNRERPTRDYSSLPMYNESLSITRKGESKCHK